MRASLRNRLAALTVLLLLAGCGARETTPATQNPLDQAAAEATAIVQSARATALVLEAHAQATALIAGAAATPVPQAATSVLPVLPSPPAALDTLPTPTAPISGSQAVQVLSVGLAAEGGFVIVNFLAPPEVATTWYQGAVWLEDEATGQLYSEIGVLPTVGPLFGRPVEPGQPGYVMLVNAPRPVAVGAVVTVVLGDYRFEHVPVE
jgi:hypothetical protein